MITEVRLIPNGDGRFSLMVNDKCVGVAVPNSEGTLGYDIMQDDYIPIDFTAPTDTRSAVATMLKWNTGSHFLDSGGFGGRWWQMRRDADLDAEPEAYLDEDGYHRNLYPFLVEHLRFDDRMQRIFDAFDFQLPTFNYFEVLEKFCKRYDILVTAMGNTYNEETVLRGGFQYYELELAGGETCLAIMSHNGADIRGGYSKPFFFSNSIEDLWVDINSGDVWCDTCDNRWYWDGYRWETDTATFNFLDKWDGSQYNCECGGKVTC
jgi:hypothetical protein